MTWTAGRSSMDNHDGGILAGLFAVMGIAFIAGVVVGFFVGLAF